VFLIHSNITNKLLFTRGSTYLISIFRYVYKLNAVILFSGWTPFRVFLPTLERNDQFPRSLLRKVLLLAFIIVHYIISCLLYNDNCSTLVML
jgi:hypothetical protein